MAIVLSESAARKLSTHSVVELEFKLNNNDVLLNLYGDGEEYKAMPDIGEEIKGGILLGYRRLFKNSMFYEMQDANLMRTFSTDTILYETGTVCDIEIFSNESIEDLEKHFYNQQIIHYLELSNQYYRDVVELIEKYIDVENRNYSDDLAYLYKRASSIIKENSRWKSDNTDFENVIIKVKIMREEPIVIGSKLSNRYGCNYSPSL